ncbi:hypothetical protein BBP40_011552 [Aspergillus hancockii]|nr:hypothetical protein BBP40_011552 [Aspergillus hancockii]
MDFENKHHLLAATQKVRAEYLKGAKTVPISVQQAATVRENPAKGPVWVSKFTVPTPPKDSSRDLLLGLVDELNDRNIRYDRPDSQPLNLEWTGFRAHVEKDNPEPPLAEKDKFDKLVAETKSPLAILYVYAHLRQLNSSSRYRRTAGYLAQSTGSKVLMVRQRLAPQNPFPAALLDVFQAYLTLLAPPPGAPHAAIPPTSIVVAGDSSGACLALGLLQILLQLKRRNKSIIFHGQPIEPAVPAGLALLSPVTELTNAFPSYERNQRSDIFPVPVEKLPYLNRSFPTCPIWPTRPPRANLYCEAGMLAHPLASPVAFDDWTGSCPLWLASGQEQIVDGTRLLAQVAHAQGVSVTLQEYEGMPHTSFFVFHQAPQAKKIMKDWADAILLFAGGRKRTSSVSFIHAKGLVAESMDVERLVSFTVAEAWEMIWKKTLGYEVPPFHRESRSTL